MLHDTKDLFKVNGTMYQFFFMIEDRGTIKGNKVDGMEDTIQDTEERRLTNDNKITGTLYSMRTHFTNQNRLRDWPYCLHPSSFQNFLPNPISSGTFLFLWILIDDSVVSSQIDAIFLLAAFWSHSALI